MIKEIKIFLYLLVIFFFIFFSIKFYLSDNNKKISYRILNKFDNKIKNLSGNLDILYNDTNNIIFYVDKKKNNNKKNYFFWKLLEKND